MNAAPLTTKQRLALITGSIALAVATALVIALGTGFFSTSTDDPGTPPLISAPEEAPTPEQPVVQPVSLPEAPEPPSALGQDELGQLPLADAWAVIPELLSQDDVAEELASGYSAIARPVNPLTGLYSEVSSDAVPVAAISNVSVEDATVLHVFAAKGGWILVGTPSRIALPSASGGNAPTVSFAWARSMDFVMDLAQGEVVIDTAASTLTLLDADGDVVRSENVVLGTAKAPTPTNTVGYIVASYTDDSQRFADGEPIILLSSHSATLDSFNGDPASTGIHYSNATSANSLGCVRVSREMTHLLDPLIGVRVTFK